MAWRQIAGFVFFSLLLILAGCMAATREVSSPYQTRLDALIRDLTDKPFSLHVVENSPRLAFVDMRTSSISVNAAWTNMLMSRSPNLMRAVLAHEIAHVQLGHYNVRYELGETIATLLQGLELEADRGAIDILHARGFNPRDYLQMMRFFKAIEDKNPRGTVEQFYSSHPYAGDRIERAEKIIAALPPLGKSSGR